MNSEYEATRLEDCREIEAVFQNQWDNVFAKEIRRGDYDGKRQVTRHFAPYDAGYSRARAEQGWQCITDAPRDGTPVDLWVIGVSTSDGFRWADICWNTERHDWCSKDGFALSCFLGAPYPEATHFMPLPAPPINQLTQGERE